VADPAIQAWVAPSRPPAEKLAPPWTELSLQSFKDIGYFNVNSEIHGYFTRTADNLHITIVRTSTQKSTLIYSGPEIWNNIPLSIRNLRYSRLLSPHYLFGCTIAVRLS